MTRVIYAAKQVDQIKSSRHGSGKTFLNDNQMCTVAKSPRSISVTLRYLEWILLTVHGLLVLSTKSLSLLGIDGEAGLLLTFMFYGIFVGLSWLYPVRRWQKQGYILLSMVLIVFANFVDVSLDLLIYLYIAKSFFLLGYRQTVWSTVAMGAAWIVSECVSELREIGVGLRFEPPFGFGAYGLWKMAIYSLGIYIAASVFVILLSSIVVAEYSSRQRAEALAEQVEVLAADLERTRIARDIHDSLGHTLTNLDIQLEVAQKLRDRNPQKAFLAVDTAKLLSSQCIEDVSHAIKTMRQPNFELNRALRNLIEQTRGNQALQIHWQLNLPQLPIATSHQIYCVVKEGLINIQKHAQASSIVFQGQTTSEEIILQLEDNGIGFDIAQSSFGSGLNGMTERVNSMGGRLTVSSTPNQGTQLLVVIPR